MVKHNRNNRHGGVVLFLCIIMSALIISQSFLFCGALLRCNEAEISRASHLQAENVLCDYSTTLFDHYGVYCFDESALNQSVFDECCRVNDIHSITVSGLQELSAENLETIIGDYMKIRFPAMLGNELIVRIGQAVGKVEKSDILKKASSDRSGVLKKYLGEYLSSGEKWSEILSNVENFIHLVDFSDKLSAFEDFVRDLKETLKRTGTMKLQGKTGSFDLDIFDPDCISKIIDALSFVIDSDTPEYLNYLYINKYAASLFDSSVIKTRDAPVISEETNIYGTPFSEINGSNKADIEFLLTGKEEKSAVNMTQSMIFASRAILNLGAFLLDKDKLSTSEGIADVISVCVALLSGGTVAIDPAIVKYLVIVTWALQKSFQDLKTLSDGGTISIIDHSSLNNQDSVKALIETRYRDYVEFFLMFVSREVLLTRMIGVFKRYTGGKLYVSVQISVQYSDRHFRLEEIYDSYKT